MVQFQAFPTRLKSARDSESQTNVRPCPSTLFSGVFCIMLALGWGGLPDFLAAASTRNFLNIPTTALGVLANTTPGQSRAPESRRLNQEG